VLYNSEHRQIPWLRALDPDPTVEIHPATAGPLGIGNGEWVWIENWFGKCLMKAKVTIEVPTWMVMAAHSWWFPEREGAEPSLHGTYRSSVNQLIPNGYQGKDGLGAPIKHGLCKVYKARLEEIANA
jgi:anaerobic selenocysteine-containing dehydrogenase